MHTVQVEYAAFYYVYTLYIHVSYKIFVKLNIVAKILSVS